VSALTRYDTRKDPHTLQLDKVLPDEPGPVHASQLRTFAPQLKEPHFPDGHDNAEALCGRRIKVQLPVAFDPGDPDACQECAVAAWKLDSGN
jgi:hypothetical protein